MLQVCKSSKDSFTAGDFKRRAAISALPLSMAENILNTDEINYDGMEQAARSGLWPKPKFASVLAGIVDRKEGAAVLLTQRALHLSSHGGQIAFPGGKIEPEDRNVIDTALREAEEEIGLSRQFVEPVGLLRPYQTSTGFRVAPVLAVIRPEFSLTIDVSEVAEAFEAPLAFLMDPANHQRHNVEWRGELRQFYVMPFEGRNIWGATAAILRDIYARLYCDAPPPPPPLVSR